MWRAPKDTQTHHHVDRLLERIGGFCRDRGWSEGYFSKVAAGDVAVVERMREGGRVTAVVMARIERFLNAAADQVSVADE